MKVRDLFSDASKWNKRALSVDCNGNTTSPQDINAVSWCLLGAMRKCYGYYLSIMKIEENNQYYFIYNKVIDYLGSSIVNWNDHPNRMFEEVKSLVEELDI